MNRHQPLCFNCCAGVYGLGQIMATEQGPLFTTPTGPTGPVPTPPPGTFPAEWEPKNTGRTLLILGGILGALFVASRVMESRRLSADY